MIPGHGRLLCRCGKVLAQCRCPIAHGNDKVSPNPCVCPGDTVELRRDPPSTHIVKRPDGHWLIIQAGGLEAAVRLIEPQEFDERRIVHRCIDAATMAEILPAKAREHVTNGPCWCGPVELGKVFKHRIGGE